MPARRTGVETIPGHLTYFLSELGLTRKAVADELGVSVRTIHNIEHGRKAVDPQMLDQLANLLSRHAREQRFIRFRQLTGQNFIQSPTASVSVFLQTIITNQAELLFLGDSPIAGNDFQWLAPGDTQLIPFAGEYRGHAAQTLIEDLHQAVGAVRLNQVRIMSDPISSTVVVGAIASFEHPFSGQVLDFKAFLDVNVDGAKLGRVESTYDTGLLSYFLQTGAPPKARKSSATP